MSLCSVVGVGESRAGVEVSTSQFRNNRAVR